MNVTLKNLQQSMNLKNVVVFCKKISHLLDEIVTEKNR